MPIFNEFRIDQSLLAKIKEHRHEDFIVNESPITFTKTVGERPINDFVTWGNYISNSLPKDVKLSVMVKHESFAYPKLYFDNSRLGRIFSMLF